MYYKFSNQPIIAFTEVSSDVKWDSSSYIRTKLPIARLSELELIPYESESYAQ